MTLNNFVERQVKMIVQREIEHGLTCPRDVMAGPYAGLGSPEVQYSQMRARIGAPSTTRTCDLLVRSQTLYPTELWAPTKPTLESNIGGT